MLEKSEIVRQMERLDRRVKQENLVEDEWYKTAKVGFSEVFQSGITNGKIRSPEKEMNRMYLTLIR